MACSQQKYLRWRHKCSQQQHKVRKVHLCSLVDVFIAFGWACPRPVISWVVVVRSHSVFQISLFLHLLSLTWNIVCSVPAFLKSTHLVVFTQVSYFRQVRINFQKILSGYSVETIVTLEVGMWTKGHSILNVFSLSSLWVSQSPKFLPLSIGKVDKFKHLGFPCHFRFSLLCFQALEFSFFPLIFKAAIKVICIPLIFSYLTAEAGPETEPHPAAATQAPVLCNH